MSDANGLEGAFAPTRRAIPDGIANSGGSMASPTSSVNEYCAVAPDAKRRVEFESRSSTSAARSNITTDTAPADSVAAAARPDDDWHVAGSKLYLVSKRALDIVGSAVGLVVLAPLMALVAAVIKLTDYGPVMYPHLRVGLNGREFRCYKFRTMVPDAENMKDELGDLNHHNDERTFKSAKDPRVTRVGKWLRVSSFDEVPQLWNVLKGDMSLVGPRPPVPSDMRRLEVKPGLTCIWQVSGRSNLPFPRQLQLDLQYIEHRSTWLDLKLILLTIPAVIKGDGAY